MRDRKSCFRAAMALAILLSLPLSAMARGGGGGGRGGGGGGGGGYSGGGRSVGVRGGGFGPGFRGGHWGGYRGPVVGYHGWGYPYYGYGLGTGLGLGLGLGLGYGLSSGYGYGYPAYGYGYPSYAYGGGTYSGATYYVADQVPSPSSVVTTSATTSASSTTNEAAANRSREFSDRGEAEFKRGNYEGAVNALRHAVVDDPQNPLLVLLLGQALFATGKYEEAAGATQTAMRVLPKEHWGAVINRYQDFYGNRQDYTRQLRTMEKGLHDRPKDPVLHFLAGYHYGYLGFHKQSVEQLEATVHIEPRDELARQLLDEMKNKLFKHEALPPVPAPTPAKDI